MSVGPYVESIYVESTHESQSPLQHFALPVALWQWELPTLGWLLTARSDY